MSTPTLTLAPTMRATTMRGYTLDQTILIVAIIAILVTIIIASMGWQLLGAASGTKLASHLRQIEAVNGQFYQKYNVWPNNNQENAAFSAAALMGDATTLDAIGVDATMLATNPAENYLPSYSLDTTAGTVSHPFGTGGQVTLLDDASEFPGQTFLTVIFSAVPADEAQKANEAIDGKTEGAGWATEGRFRVDTTTGVVTYFANAK